MSAGHWAIGHSPALAGDRTEGWFSLHSHPAPQEAPPRGWNSLPGWDCGPSHGIRTLAGRGACDQLSTSGPRGPPTLPQH